MKEEIVQFSDKQGREIVGTLLTPDGDGPFPAVIVCHGFKGDRNQIHLKRITECLTEKGLVLLRIDFTRDPGESSLPFAEMTVSYELEVLDEAVKFLTNHSEVDPTKIGLAGHSLGGLVAAWYAANHPKITALVTLSAVYSFTETFDRHYKTWVEESEKNGFGYVYTERRQEKLKLMRVFYTDGIKFEMDRVIAELNCPVLVVCGTNDSLLNHSQMYFDRLQIKQKELKVIEGADHGYSDPEHLEEVATTVATWFAKILLEQS